MFRFDDQSLCWPPTNSVVICGVSWYTWEPLFYGNSRVRIQFTKYFDLGSLNQRACHCVGNLAALSLSYPFCDRTPYQVQGTERFRHSLI